jgi:hypothetical protein
MISFRQQKASVSHRLAVQVHMPSQSTCNTTCLGAAIVSDTAAAVAAAAGAGAEVCRRAA